MILIYVEFTDINKNDKFKKIKYIYGELPNNNRNRSNLKLHSNKLDLELKSEQEG